MFWKAENLNFQFLYFGETTLDLWDNTQLGETTSDAIDPKDRAIAIREGGREGGTVTTGLIRTNA